MRPCKQGNKYEDRVEPWCYDDGSGYMKTGTRTVDADEADGSLISEVYTDADGNVVADPSIYNSYPCPVTPPTPIPVMLVGDALKDENDISTLTVTAPGVIEHVAGGVTTTINVTEEVSNAIANDTTLAETLAANMGPALISELENNTALLGSLMTAMSAHPDAVQVTDAFGVEVYTGLPA